MVNYLSLLEAQGAHFECDGTGDLIDSIAGVNFTEVGVVAEQSDGPLNKARGECDGNYATGRGFFINPTGNVFDSRVSSGCTGFTLIAGFRLNANALGQEIAASGRATVPVGQWQFLCRCVHQLGAPNEDAYFGLYDHFTGLQFRAIGAGRSAEGRMPLNEWCMYGASVDLAHDGGNGQMRLFLGVRSEGVYYNTHSPISGWDPLEGNDDLMTLGIGASHSNEGIKGDIGPVDWIRNWAAEEEDFLHFWNNGSFQSFPGGYIDEVPASAAYYFGEK